LLHHAAEIIPGGVLIVSMLRLPLLLGIPLLLLLSAAV
jgi:hypothetical protein